MKTSLEPSNIAGSPYIYLTIFLTHHEFKGPHIVVSDAKEWEDREGILVGRNEDDDDRKPPADVEYFPTLQEALVRVKELME